MNSYDILTIPHIYNIEYAWLEKLEKTCMLEVCHPPSHFTPRTPEDFSGRQCPFSKALLLNRGHFGKMGESSVILWAGEP